MHLLNSSCLRATTLLLVMTLMPSLRMKYSVITSPTSLSSRGRSRLEDSSKMTLVPSSAKYSAISQPVEPAPTTATILGRRLILMASSGL